MIFRRKIISGSTGPIFASFTLNKSVLSADDQSFFRYFRYLQTLPWQPILRKNGKLPTVISLAFRNEMGNCYLSVRINSANDACISCEKFVKFGPVTTELTELICEHLVRHRQILLNISGSTGLIFAIFAPYKSALGADDKSGPYFPIWQGPLPWQPNNVAVMKAN